MSTTSKLRRASDEVHRARIDAARGAARRRDSLADLGDHVAPQARRFEHVGLVDRSDELAARAREIEADDGDAADLVFGVDHGVEPAARLALDAARLAEVEIAEQLAHDDHVGAANDLGAKG